ncbi:MAG: TIGR00730 family Rossman fold protein [Acidimicrobiales bacterium]|nr:TIGR00730 family Rossman fold protein [Acidimicrobiales bacterium]|tara:strand:- start:685 stop:1287 length:603 start_codon:yes stop_codon:yes gene_type:complete
MAAQHEVLSSRASTSQRPALGVFCGSRAGRDGSALTLARELGGALAGAGIDLVYGGAGIGVMGTLADAVLDAGGRVVGVIPTGLFSHEVPHRQLTERIEVADMHERKRTMYARSDAFCGLPGGYGTLEEVFEAATWNQLGLHDRPKPIALLDGGAPGSPGFWSHLERFLDNTMDEGFLKPGNRSLVTRVGTVAQVLALVG